MEKPAQLSPTERKILIVYLLSALGVLGLFFLLGLIIHGLPGVSPPMERAEIAVLAPYSGSQSELGLAVFSTVGKALSAYPDRENLKVQQLSVVAYDTQGTLQGAANAANRAARNPATAAIIGPLDADQALVAVETLEGKNLIVITPASTAPTLELNRHPGLYRIPAADDLQGDAIADFLDRRGLVEAVFLLAEPSSYVQGVLKNLNEAAEDRLKFVDSINLDQGGVPEDLAQRIEDTEARVVVFLGSLENARSILFAMNQAQLEIPFVGIDAINDPAMLPLNGPYVPVYYTSPILGLEAFPEDEMLAFYRQSLADNADSPFAYEATQAVWFTLGALSNQSNLSPRETVWESIRFVTSRGARNAAFRLMNGQLLPQEIYVYTIPPDSDQWSQNPVVHVFQER